MRLLTEIAHQNGIGTDYHLNEPPQPFVDTITTAIRTICSASRTRNGRKWTGFWTG